MMATATIGPDGAKAARGATAAVTMNPIAGTTVEIELRELALFCGSPGEERLGTLLECLADGVLIADSDGRIVLVNAGVEEMFGYERKKLLRQPVETLIPEPFRAAQHAHRERYLSWPEARPTGLRADLVGRRRDGTEFPVEVRLTAVETHSGTLVVALISDITERKRAEEALRESEGLNRSLLHAIPDMMFRIKGNGTFLAFIPAAGLEPCVPPSDFIGKTVYEVMPPEVAQQGMRSIEAALQSGKPQHLEYQLEMHGEDLYYEARIVVTAVNEVLAIVRDLTAQKLEEQREARRKARDELEGKVERQILGKNPYGLTFREFTVLHLVAAGEADKQIADQLDISKYTVNKHVANILAKMGASSRTDACVRALREGLLG